MENQKTKPSKKNTLYLIVIVLVIASVLFRLTNDYGLEQSSIVFIGIPALITLFVIRNLKTPKSLYGIVALVVTLFLLMSTILFGEGFICILMASPLFYGIPLLIVAIYKYFNKKDNTKIYSFIAIPIILIIAQPLEINKTPKTQTVESSIIVDGKISLEEFNNSPDFNNDIPDFFKLGFPKPLDIEGSGLENGDFRKIRFESQTRGIGSLTLAIIDSNDSTITFKATDDDTHINHWLTWKEIKVNIQPFEGNKTKVTWTSNYTCDLGPSWYFEPMEEYAVNKMNLHLINSYFK